VRLRKGRVGIIRYIGYPNTPAQKKGKKKSKPVGPEMIGLECPQWFDKGNDGDLNGRNYFKCRNGTGYWTKRDLIAEVTKVAEVKTASKPARAEVSYASAGPSKSLDVRMNDKVQLNKGRVGIVRYLSPKGVLGLELDEWSPDGNDGSTTNKKGETKRFFTCDKGRGYFTTLDKVAVIIDRAEDSEAFDFEPAPAAAAAGPAPTRSTVSFKIGDRVALNRGRVGTVRYIGKTDFAKGEVVGLELDQWSEKGNDGSVKGKRYFKTKGAGWGYFTKPESIAEVISSSGGYDGMMP